MFDDTSWFEPFVETWTKTKLAWVSTPAVRSFEEFPAMDEWPALAAEFAKTQ